MRRCWRRICPTLTGRAAGRYDGVRSTRSPRVSEFDSPWKEALERFLPQFLEFFFRRVFEGVDWSRGYESLDKELQQIVREAELGLRLADKLFKVFRLGGEEAWVLGQEPLRPRIDGRRNPATVSGHRLATGIAARIGAAISRRDSSIRGGTTDALCH